MKLVAIAGPLRGSVFHIEGSEFTVGRAPSSSLFLDDPAVSRQHCVFRADGGKVVVTDLESRNGTLVNRAAVKSRPLKGGEEIQIGQSVFLLTAGEPGEPGIPDLPEPISKTIVLNPRESVYLRGAAERHSRIERELAGLLRFSASLASPAENVEALEQRIRTLTPELLPCDSVVIRDLDSVTPEGTAEHRALAGGCAVLEGARVLVAPLHSRGRTVSLLRLESSSGSFDDSHLQLAGALSAIASLALDNARHIEDLERENQFLADEAGVSFDMVGESPRMREVFQLIARAAPSSATLLVLGESGTGKELVARAIHRNSPRSARPFVAVNCAALTESLLESELFGHEKGSFTGATAQKRGRIELAEGGTLFLDEVGELAPQMQAKLLRVLQEREFERVGGTRTLHADIRLIAATNRNLEDAVKKGTFRQDLYYRLNVIAIRMPPLRDRREDIVPLANFLAQKHAARVGRKVAGLSAAARASLVQYDWPGNVRELENAIERAVVLGATEWILPEDLPDLIGERAPAEASGYHDQVREAKRRILSGALEQMNGNQAAAARLLGLNPTYLSRLLRNLGDDE